MTAVFDADILIDLLKGLEAARQEVHAQSDRAVNLVTWMEVMVGAVGDREHPTRRLLSEFRLIPLTGQIAERAVLERRIRRVTLPDAIVVATATVTGGVLLTRNTRDFRRNEKHVCIPYRLPAR